MQLYNKHRPPSFDKVIGNEDLIAYLQKAIVNKRIPQALLLHGPTGCGKTTIARIFAKEVGCSGIDFRELDTATFNGIATVRSISKSIGYVSMKGGARVWLIDEVHKMTTDAQNAMLKLLEEPVKNLYFILCTTDPQKLLPTVKGRCIQLKVNLLTEGQIIKELNTIAKKEGVKIKREVLEQIALDSLGHPRNAIQILEKIIFLKPKQMLKAAEQTALEQSKSFELCKALISATPWKKVANILKGLKGQEPEGIRRHVLGYAEAVLLKSNNSRAALIIEEFIEPLYNVGFPGLVFYCYCVING